LGAYVHADASIARAVTQRFRRFAVDRRVKPLGLGWPNMVSIGRVLLVPIIVALIVERTDTAAYLAAAAFVVGALSDGLDGWLARRHEMRTSTGAWLDPLSDKLLVAVPMIALALIRGFPPWAAAVIVGRELAVQALRWRLDSRSVSMPASPSAKAKTVSQLLAVFLYILPLSSAWHTIRLAFVVAAVALTVITGAEYFLTTRHRVEAR
jgi:CDP-diacylglycerol--glycerol-3-phosphate 3-phosphatidyltransferase